MMVSSRASGGFSLIEVLVALVLLGVGLMGLARLQLVLLAGTADTAAYDHAVRLANDRVESLRLTRLAGGLPVTGTDEQPVQGILFQRAWTVACPSEQSCHAKVTVRWRSPRASPRSRPTPRRSRSPLPRSAGPRRSTWS